MENVICIYHDDQGDQDMALDPNLDQALSNFDRFDWGSAENGGAIKVLYFSTQIDSQPSIMITNNPFEEMWCVTASMRVRRRFCGPFFKQTVTKMVLDIDRNSVADVIRTYFSCSPDEFLSWLKQEEVIASVAS